MAANILCVRSQDAERGGPGARNGAKRAMVRLGWVRDWRVVWVGER